MSDRDFMSLALGLAWKGEGHVHPNPLVGAVVVRDGRIVGQGYHERFGGPHAEVNALAQAADQAQGATLYVTLEPCCHHGKTPPCTDRIIASGVRRVLYAVEDPNPQVCGRGAATLRAHGIDVESGLLREEAEEQNEIFLTWTRRGTPFVELKLALSLDGRIATKSGDSKWITGEPSRIEGHRLRRRHAAVAVGVNTVIRDDPALTVRHVAGRDPLPVVLDSTGRIPLTARLLQSPSRAVVATCSMPADVEQRIRATGAQIWRLPGEQGRVAPRALLARMAEASLSSLLIEGGGEVAASFLEAGVVDKATLFYAPILIGGRDATPGVGGIGAATVADALRLERVRIRQLGDDVCLSGYVKNPA